MEVIVARLKKRKAALAAELGRIDAAIEALTGGKKSVSRKSKGRKRRKMTAAQRRAVSIRMKKSWAERKKRAGRR